MTKNKKTIKWIQIAPYGIVGGMIPGASTLMFKRKNKKGHFSVWLSELQSRMTVEQSLNKEQPFHFVQKILKATKNIPKRCYFLERREDRDIVVVTFSGSIKSIRFYADEVISFCILNHCQFFCTEEFFKKPSRELPQRFKNQLSHKRPDLLN